MKKLLTMLLAIAVLSFAACSDDAASEEKAPENKTDTVFTKDANEIEALADTANSVLEKTPKYSDTYPAVDDVAAQYKLANMAIGWIVGTEKVATDSSDTYEYDGLVYERVRPDCYYGISNLNNKDLGNTIGLIYNMKTLEGYIATLIDPEEAAEYMYDIKNSFEVEKFVEDENGALYALPYAYTPSGYTNEETYDLFDNGDGTYTFTVTYGVKKSDGSVGEYSEDFGFEQVDGRWVLTDFYVVKQN